MRLREIDFLRGIAVILVLFRHKVFISALYYAGWIGVDLFFVLSGFLVSGLLFKQYLKKEEMRVVNFLIRRGFKIYPIFYFAILLTILIKYLKGQDIDGYDLISELLFVQNYLGAMWNHTWSLAVEEHFYFGLALAIVLVVRGKVLDHHRKIVVGAVCILFTCLFLRLYHATLGDFNPNRQMLHTHLRIDSLLFGVMLSYFYHFKRDHFITFFRKYRYAILSFSFLAILPAFFFRVESFMMYTVGFSLLYLGFGALLGVVVADDNINKRLNNIFSKSLVNFVSKIGFYSYSIYVFHMFVANYLMVWLNDLGLMNLIGDWSPKLVQMITFTIYFLVSVFAGILISEILEQPFLKIREKYFPKKEVVLAKTKGLSDLPNVI